MNERLLKEFENIKNEHLSLDMTRGKPSTEQLDLSMPMMDVINSHADLSDSYGVDSRNYGKLDGLDECKEFLADITGTNKDNIIIFGNSSLNVMYDCVADSMLYGINGSTPWSKLGKVKWLCPIPGYDRHFAICEHLGIEMINIPLHEDGPDMDLIEELIKDPLVKGIWCVPQYSNPSGTTYSNEIVDRFAKLKPDAKDFRIYWDNAYSFHHLYEDKQEHIPNILSLAKKYHNEDIVYEFVSTSKISFPGSGIAALIASNNNLKSVKEHLQIKTISYDKVNQLRHVRFFKDLSGVKEQMKKHANILRPKFEYVEKRLEEVKDYCYYSKPLGGYFISLYVKNKAKEIISKCKEAGLRLTDAGCAYPYHNDPTNSHIRLAPSYMSKEELVKAMDILVLVIKIECEKK